MIKIKRVKTFRPVALKGYSDFESVLDTTAPRFKGFELYLQPGTIVLFNPERDEWLGIPLSNVEFYELTEAPKTETRGRPRKESTAA